MNTSTIKRFLTALSSTVKIERGQLYQLVQSAEASYYLRDVNSQREIGLLLQSFGYPFNQVGKYYESIFLFRTGQSDKARQLLENVAESAPERYRSKALLSISRVEQSVGHFEESLRLRLQIQQQPSSDPVTLIEAQQGIAILRSIEGDHRGAMRELERLMPLAHVIGKHGHPAYISFLNSYALELSEVGRDTEAEQAANVIAASPFIYRYWEFRETVSEVLSKRKSRSMVSFALLKKQIEEKEAGTSSNVLQFPTGERIAGVRAALESGEIRELSLTPLQLLALILRMMFEERVTDEEIEKVCVLYYDTVTKWYPPDWPSGI